MFHAIVVRRSDNIIIAEACNKSMEPAEFEASNTAAMLGYKVEDIYMVIEWVDEQDAVIDRIGEDYESINRL